MYRKNKMRVIEYSLFSISSRGTSKPYTVILEVAGQQLQI